MVVQLLPPAEAAPVSQAGGRRDVIRVGTALKPGQRWSRHQLSAVCMDAPGTRFWVALRPGDKRSGAEVEIREFRQVCSEQIGSIRHQLAAFARIGVGGYVRDMVHVAGAGKLAVLMSTGEVLLYNDQSLSKDVNLSYVIATKSARVLAVKPPSAGQAAVLAVVSQTAPADIQLHLLEVFPVAGTPGVRLLATPWTIHQDASRFAASEPQFVRGAAWGDATLFLAHDSYYQAISPGPRTAAPRLTPEVRVVHENPRDSPAAVPAASPPAASASPPPSTSSSSSPTSSRAPAEPPPAAGAPLPRSALLAALPPLDAACSGGGWASGGGGRGQVLMLVQLGRGEAAGQLLRGDGEPDALPGSGSSLVLFQGCQPLALAAASLYLLVICATHISVLDRRDGSEVQRLALDLREKLLRSEPAGAKQQLLQRELRVAFSPCGASLLLGLRTQVLLLELLPLAQQVRQLLKQQQLQAAASLLEHADALRSSGEAGPGEAAGEAARSPTSRRSSSSWLQQAWGQLGLLLLHQRQLPAALAALGRCSTAHWQPAALLRLVPEHSHPWADELPEASFWGLAPPLGRCQQAHGDVPDGPGTMTHVTSHAASATVSPDSVSPNSPPPAASGDEPSPPAPQLPGQLPPGDLLHAPASASAGPGSEEGDQASSGSSRGECLWRLSSQECEELVQYLMAVRRVPGVVLADAIDSVLVLLLASLQDHAALARFAQEANKVVVDAVRDKLKRADELHTLALLLKSKGRAREAVDLWTRMLAPNGPGATGVPPAAQDHRAAEALAATLAEPALVPEPEVVLESLAGLAAQAGLCASALRVLTARDDLAVPDVIALLDRLGDGPDPCSLRWRFLLHRTGAPGPPVPRQYQDMLVLTLSHFLLRCEAARPERDRWLAALQPREDLDSLHAVLQRYLQTSCGFSKLLVRRQLQALCRQDGGSARMLLQLVAAHKRMGEDEAALLILALRVKDLPQAIQYCSTSRDDKLWLDLLEMLMDPEPAELRLAGLGLAGSAAGGGAVAAQQPMYAEACLLLSAPGANNLDPVKVLEKLDEGMPLCVAAATLERMAKGHIHRRRHARLALHLLKRVELQLKEKLWRERMRYVVFGGADGVSRCSGCGTSLTGSGIATGRVTVVPPPPAPISAAATAQKPCPQRIPELWCFACSQREGWRIPKENEFD